MPNVLHVLIQCFWIYGVLCGGQTLTDSVTVLSQSPVGKPYREDAYTTTAAQSVRSKSKPVADLAAHGSDTCPSRTINYITHTLPQQCLRTERHSRTASESLPNYAESTVTGHPAQTSHRALDGTGVVNYSGTGTSDLPETIVSAPSSAIPHHEVVTNENAKVATSGPTSGDESESALDGANFLSFEEWKKQNLEKAGQSPDDVGRSQSVNADRPRPDLSSAFDTLGEESEIDLDFTGFASGAKPPRQADKNHETSVNGASDSDQQAGASLTIRSKDAGKTCKERTNYASFDCAATALKSNKECKSVSSILIENKDSYMLNICSADNKFVIVELCDDILIDTVVLANYEFFSSSFRHFRVSVSDRYPVKIEKWKDLGTFEARNTREIQAFLVENPLIWARYLRIEFLTHYGSEYYCPVSLLRVHGTTMLEEFRHQEELNRGEDEDIPLVFEVSQPHVAEPKIVTPHEVTRETKIGVVEGSSTSDTSQIASASMKIPSSEPKPSSTITSNQTVQATTATCKYERPGLNTSCERTQASLQASKEIESFKVTLPSQGQESKANVRAPASAAAMTSAREQGTNAISRKSSSAIASTPSDDVSPPQTEISASAKNSSTTSVVTTRSSAEGSSKPVVLSSSRPLVSSQQSNATSIPSPSVNRTVVSSPSVAGSQQAQPSTQESFFKSVHKRLQQLESNSTLSLKYIEEQSRILRDAFSKVEKRQVSTTAAFLSNLNQTVTMELHGFRQAYDQLWQSTVLELEGQREQSQRELFALSARLTLVADELVWQKRMGILQSTLLLLCLAVVLFGRPGGNGYLEMPLMQQVMNRSTAALRSGWESPPTSPLPGSPSPESRSPASLFRRKIWRRSAEAPAIGNLTDSDKEGPEVRLEPPTPPSTRSTQSEDERSSDEENAGEEHGSHELYETSIEEEEAKQDERLEADLDESNRDLRKTLSLPG